MIKSGITVLIVDSVEKTVKYYTEKLAFDIADLKIETLEKGKPSINYAMIKKGKCFLILRRPKIEELAEFSFIKRCASRCTGVYAEMKKGIEKYYAKCQKKEVQITSPLKNEPWGHKTFSIRDPFGLRITFAQPIEGFQSSSEFLTSGISKNDIAKNKELKVNALEKMIKYLKGLGILRRASKKYSKHWIKQKTKEIK